MSDLAALPFDAVLRRFDPMCRRLARAYHAKFPCHEPEDYYQLASIGLWRAHERLRGGHLQIPARFAGYARAVARSEIWRFLSRANFLVSLPESILRRRRPGQELRELLAATQPLSLDGPAPGPSTYGIAQTLAELVPAPEPDLAGRLDLLDALMRLPPPLRQHLLAVAAGGAPAEIARAAGLSVRTLYTYVWQARRELAGGWWSEGEGAPGGRPAGGRGLPGPAGGGARRGGA